jgi:hypothetical protein
MTFFYYHRSSLQLSNTTDAPSGVDAAHPSVTQFHQDWSSDKTVIPPFEFKRPSLQCILRDIEDTRVMVNGYF